MIPCKGSGPSDLCFPVVPTLVQAVSTFFLSGLFGSEGLIKSMEGLEDQQLGISCVLTAFLELGGCCCILGWKLLKITEDIRYFFLFWYSVFME